MPKLSSVKTVRYYARLGAEAKVRELKAQIAEILAVFPDIAATESLSRGKPSAVSTPRISEAELHALCLRDIHAFIHQVGNTKERFHDTRTYDARIHQ